MVIVWVTKHMIINLILSPLRTLNIRFRERSIYQITSFSTVDAQRFADATGRFFELLFPRAVTLSSHATPECITETFIEGRLFLAFRPRDGVFGPIVNSGRRRLRALLYGLGLGR